MPQRMSIEYVLDIPDFVGDSVVSERNLLDKWLAIKDNRWHIMEAKKQ
jgi:hypothetical protein